MVSPSYGHCVCAILYSLYNLNCKHQTRTIPNYDNCFASLLIVPCYKKIYIPLIKKTKLHNKDVVRSKNSQLNHMRRSSIWKLSHFELHWKELRISFLSFTAWWLNQQVNNNNNINNKIWLRERNRCEPTVLPRVDEPSGSSRKAVRTPKRDTSFRMIPKVRVTVSATSRLGSHTPWNLTRVDRCNESAAQGTGTQALYWKFAW